LRRYDRKKKFGNEVAVGDACQKKKDTPRVDRSQKSHAAIPNDKCAAREMRKGGNSVEKPGLTSAVKMKSNSLGSLGHCGGGTIGGGKGGGEE